ncbi:MAG: hypothetical protein Tsb0034_19480 [Ekhidna sp.]
MKSILKYLLAVLAISFVIGFLVYLFIDKPLPNGTKGNEAEQLADEMLSALNKRAFDSLNYIGFTFRDVHSYQWDLAAKKVTVAWDEQSIELDLNSGVDDYNLLEYKAYEYFINDSFWLIAPFKVRDDGVVRSTVKLDEGRGLLVSYTSGGLTPGDSYLWIIDERGFPKEWRLWTSNVPIGGLSFTWEGWVEMNEVWFSTQHDSWLLELGITDVMVR